MNVSANYFNRLGSFERCSYKIFNWQVEDSWGILCILHVLNVQCALLQLYIYSHYGVINEQVMPPERRHEYGRMGAVCRRSRGMSNEKVKPGRQKDIAKATISSWIKGIIRSAYSEAKSEDIPHLTSQNVQARELRAMATSLAFHQHHSLKQVMEAACWRVDSTFASFYLIQSPSQTRGYDYLRPATTYDRQWSWAVAVIFTTIVRAVTHYDRFTTGLQWS